MIHFAVISDVHGNIWALDAVLADIAARGIEDIINLGDTLYGPLDPVATARRLMAMPVVSIQGNEDRIILAPPETGVSSTLAQVLEELPHEIKDWLAAQPASLVTSDGIYLCHGTPPSDETYLLECPSEQGGFLQPPEFIRKQLSGIDQEVILCGHSHIPRTVCLADGRIVLNPGSVGLPAYADDRPVPHKMANGSPHARYAILTQTSTGWKVEQIAVPYAYDRAVAMAIKNRRHDWATWLQSGRA